jgi:hypothetical protein
VQFFNWLCEVVGSSEVTVCQLTLHWDYLRRHLNNLCNRYYLADNPRLIHKALLLHDITVGVWCVFSATELMASLGHNNWTNSRTIFKIHFK